jgi:inosine-uridine nucleoside N-ribohydrolase
MNSKTIFTGFAALTLTIAAGLGARGQSAPVAGDQPAAPQLVIVDTDIGDDIDDAFALALLLRSPEVKLLGVTTAYGDTELRARLVDRYLQAVGRNDVPVTAGVATPHSNVFSQAAYARQSPQREHPGSIKFLLEQIRAHPGQITLIAIGPLTNLRVAIERDPATFRQLQRVVMMGGSVYRGYDGENPGEVNRTPSSEWNIRCDPPAARALLASGVPVFMMPLDSTQIRLTQPELAAVFSQGSPLTDQLTLLYHQWAGAGAWRMPTLFDPVAAAYAIRPEICPTQPMHLDVDEKGFTRPGPGTPNVQVCLNSEEKGFRAFLLQRILGAPAQ